MSDRHVIVVGAGPGGLTAAMILARRGVRVTVYESQSRVGGRNGAITLGGYTFDIGPTFLMLRSALDEVFEEAGTKTDDVMDMRKLEPMYRLQFADRYLDPYSDTDKMIAEIARAFPGHEQSYAAFKKREGKRFDYMYPCLKKPYNTVTSLFCKDLFKAVPHLALGKSLADVMHGYFKEEELALSFTFQSKYLGMSPWDCPGLFAMVPYIEHSGGVFHPIGGLSRISDSMADVARGHGAEIHLDTPVDKVLVKNGKATGVRLDSGDTVEADEVIINADFGHAMTHLFEPGVIRKYTPKALKKKSFSCSTFMLYLGVDKQYDMPHHTIVFAEDYRRNVDAIFQGVDPDTNISFYVRDATVTDPTLAPEGHSAIYVLVPVPNLRGDMNWETHAEVMREITLRAIERRTPMHDLREHITEERIVTPVDWRDEFAVHEGATFNLGHNLSQMLFLRPHNKFEEADNCYLVGGGTHPGSGLPTIYESGRIAADMIAKA